MDEQNVSSRCGLVLLHGESVIHYHGAAGASYKFIASVFVGRHLFVSYEQPNTIENVADICSTFAIDNGAFSAWKQGKPYDFDGFGQYVEKWQKHPAYHFHIIPDIIDGTEDDNRKLIASWTLDGVPVWHMHESIGWFDELCHQFSFVAIGSSAQYSSVGTSKWWHRINEALTAICDEDGRPPCRLHGLRMMNIAVFTKIPFHSVDSTVAIYDSQYDVNWSARNAPKPRHLRGLVIADRIESFQSAPTWTPQPIQRGLF